MSTLVLETSQPTISHRIAVLFVVTIASFILLFNLGANKLQSWDEAIYAQSAKEMIQTGDWLTPHWNQEKFLQKPPLTIWATAISFRIFGVNEFAARLFASLCGIVCVLLTVAIGRMFLSETHALMAGLALVVTPHFNYYARQGSMDVPLTAFLLLSIYAYLKSTESERWWLLVGTGLGLAGLTKGVAVLPGFLALAMAILLTRPRPFTTRYFWIACGLCVLIAGSWHIAMLQIHGQSFYEEYFGQQVVSRSVSTFDTTAASPLYYLSRIFLGALPFTPFVVLGSWQAWRSKKFPFVLLGFGVSVFGLYSVVPTKHQWYVVPIYPILVLLLCSVKTIPRALAVALFLCAGAYCFVLDKAIPSIHPGVPGAIASAARQPGAVNVPIDIAPAVLFYTDKKICTHAPHHSMGSLTKCR
jgi:4-amino-4-deoxy-L-arabinose transferase-like glycosyltransferase